MRILTSYIFILAVFSCTHRSGVQPAVFPVTEYGAQGDSLSMDTRAIQNAIDAAAVHGGGRVIVPPGVYRSGTIFLKSNVIFEVMNGARILGSADIADYTPLTWGHNKDRQPYHLIVIEDPVPNVERAKSQQFSPRNPDAKIAAAALVAENVRNLVVDNFNIDWPETENTPEGWRHPKRIANGTLDAFYPSYDPARQTEFSAVWGRNLQGGYIRAPLAQPSSPEKSRLDIRESSISIVN